MMGHMSWYDWWKWCSTWFRFPLLNATPLNTANIINATQPQRYATVWEVLHQRRSLDKTTPVEPRAEYVMIVLFTVKVLMFQWMMVNCAIYYVVSKYVCIISFLLQCSVTQVYLVSWYLACISIVFVVTVVACSVSDVLHLLMGTNAWEVQSDTMIFPDFSCLASPECSIKQLTDIQSAFPLSKLRQKKAVEYSLSAF